MTSLIYLAALWPLAAALTATAVCRAIHNSKEIES